MISASK